MYKLYIKSNINSKDLLNQVLLEYNITNYELIYNKNGKPYLKGNPLYFNISHDKDICVLVISDKEIGVDVEYLTYKQSIVNKYFTKNEKDIMNNSNNLLYDFTKIWVIKESFIKMQGKTILDGLKKIDTTKLRKEIDIIDKKEYLIAICRKKV